MEFKQASEVIKSLAAAVSAVEGAYAELSAARANGNAEIQALDREIETKTRNAASLDARVQSASQRASAAEGKARDEEARLAGLKESVKETSADLSAARDQLNSLKAAVGGIRS